MTDSNSQLGFEAILSRIRFKLPIQNPLHSFVHNNILMMFEDKDFHDALADAGALYRAKSYWPVSRYKEKYEAGKIVQLDILEAISRYSSHYDLNEHLKKLDLHSKDFFFRLMFSDLAFNDDEMQPEISDEHLWKLCAEKMGNQTLTFYRDSPQYRGKDYWEKYYNESISSTTHPYIIRLISSFLDQGQGLWSNPFITKGFWAFFCYDVLAIQGFTPDWMKNLTEKVKKYQHVKPQEILEKELERIKVPRECWEEYLLNLLFDLKGWAGMVNKLELEPWQATVKAPNMKLIDYMAALILIETSLDEFHANNHSTDLSIVYGRQEALELKSYQLTLALYQITKSFQLNERWMQKYSPSELLQIVESIDQAEKNHHVRLWHEAYECHFYREALGALMDHKTIPNNDPSIDAQLLFCIDDREESIRRHVEEANPKLKTFGVVGFFGIDMNFSSLKHQRLIAQCPPVVTPSRIISEIPKNLKIGQEYSKFSKFRAGHDLRLYYQSRTLFRGFFSTLILGTLSIVPMFLQVFFPKQSRLFREWLLRLFSPTPETEMVIEKSDDTHGYTKKEMAGIVEIIFKMCGLTNDFSSLVVLLAHGSTSNNNPFKQAYGCGACGGNAGVPNSRVFAKMANDPAVRLELKNVGVDIPKETIIIAGFHDTCTDEIYFFDIDTLPVDYQKKLAKIKVDLDHACKLNAFERCQRFSSEDAKGTPDDALKHVRERAEDLAQPRPEYGHSTNALAIVGSRNLTKGLFLNRRSFLLTYDWSIDPDGIILKQIILGGIPVCVNINMDYYFSCVDNDNFGCGSKLPLNLTGLLGVMTGSQSDLRIGLARQMVEIHEPIRNLSVIEAPLARVKAIFDGHPRLKKLLYHHWMRLVVTDPVTKEWYMFGETEFKKIDKENRPGLKHFNDSVDLINHTHSDQDFAEIGK